MALEDRANRKYRRIDLAGARDQCIRCVWVDRRGAAVGVLLAGYPVFRGGVHSGVGEAHGRELEPEDHAVKVTEGERARQGIASECMSRRWRNEQRRHARGSSGHRWPKPTPTSASSAAATAAEVEADQQRPYTFGAAGAVRLLRWPGWRRGTSTRTGLTRKQVAGGAAQAPYRRRRGEDWTREPLEGLPRTDGREAADRPRRSRNPPRRPPRPRRETGRPLWMVQSGDLIGGRWSKV